MTRSGQVSPVPEIGTPGLRWRGLETAYGEPKRARSWKRRIQPRGAYGALRQSPTLLKTAKALLQKGLTKTGTPGSRRLPSRARPSPGPAGILKAARAVPEVIAGPIDPSLELEPVTDQDLPDDPAMTIHEGDMP